jgi:hypothetical protein
MFWIRFVGIFLNVAPHYETMRQSQIDLFGEEVAATHPMFRLVREFTDATRALAGALPADELFYAEYRRHCECHPRQNHYRSRLGGDGRLLPVRSNILGDERQQTDSETTLRQVIRRYELNEINAAKAIADKVLEPLGRVERAAKPLCSRMPQFERAQ